MSILDNILGSLVIRSGGRLLPQLQGNQTRPWNAAVTAKKQIKDLVLKLVGPDERYETPPGNGPQIIRNELRAELRKKVEEL